MQDFVRNGIRLAYMETGRGAPPLVFVHEVAGDHTHFAPQVAHFGQRHRVVAVDLRGHGASDAPEQDYTIAGFADDLAWLCQALALYKPVIVGHGLGGLIALDLAARYPDQLGAVVILDLFPTSVGYDTLVDTMLAAFDPADDLACKARILAQVRALPPYVGTSCWAHSVIGADPTAMMRRCQVPVLLLCATASVAQAAPDEHCPAVLVGQTVGAGHWHQLEVPDQVNAMIARFLMLLVEHPTTPGAAMPAGTSAHR